MPANAKLYILEGKIPATSTSLMKMINKYKLKNHGVYIDNQLKFNKQIGTVINKANSKLAMICRSFKHLDGDMMIQL